MAAGSREQPGKNVSGVSWLMRPAGYVIIKELITLHFLPYRSLWPVMMHFELLCSLLSVSRPGKWRMASRGFPWSVITSLHV